MKLSLKLSLLIIMLLLMALLMLAYLNYCKFEKYTGKLFDSRFSLIADELRSTMEFGLDLGTTLSEMKTIQAKLADYFKLEQSLVRITIRDHQQKTIFEQTARNLPSQTEGQQIRTIRLPVNNSFHKAMGSIELVYSRNFFLLILQNTLLQMTHKLISIMLLILVISLLVIHRLLKNFSDVQDRTGQMLEGFLHETPVPESTGQDHWIEQKFREIIEDCRQVLKNNDRTGN